MPFISTSDSWKIAWNLIHSNWILLPGWFMYSWGYINHLGFFICFRILFFISFVCYYWTYFWEAMLSKALMIKKCLDFFSFCWFFWFLLIFSTFKLVFRSFVFSFPRLSDIFFAEMPHYYQLLQELPEFLIIYWIHHCIS